MRKVIFRKFYPQKKRKVHRQIKDRLFRFLFEKDRESLLQLYNALNGTDYKDVSQLRVVTIESVVYVVVKSDLAIMMAGVLDLYEHQSTYNPNMPVRFLVYLAQEYQMIVEEVPESLYGSRQITLPTPHCVVFYNGDREVPEEQILRLSDAFENKELKSDVELTVRMLNINYGHNKNLMEKCGILGEYAEFVSVTKGFIANNSDRKKALNDAVEYCIDNHILEGFLRKYRAEVVGMLLEEFDRDKYERSLREEGRIEGEERKLIEQVCKKLKRGKNVEEIADELEEDIAIITTIYKIAEEFAPYYDTDRIYSKLHAGHIFQSR